MDRPPAPAGGGGEPRRLEPLPASGGDGRDEPNPCPGCGLDQGAGPACQCCDQLVGFPVGVRLSSLPRRVAAHLLDAILTFVTFVVGWLVWSIRTWPAGQSPAKRLLGMCAIDEDTGKPATTAKMALREALGKTVGLFLAPVTMIMTVLMVTGLNRKRQQIWDKLAGTVVVDDRHGKLRDLSLQGEVPHSRSEILR